jgi:RNA polymerase sigma factor (sigma-70 family)
MPESIKAMLRTLFFERYPQLRKHLSLRLGSQDLADDALHETYLRVESINATGTIKFPLAYLFRIAHNVAEDQRKSNARLLSEQEVDDLYEYADELADPARTISAVSELDALKRALDELPPRRREIVLAARVEELPHAQIAARFGISPRTVEKELRAGLEHCCARLDRRFIQRFGPGAGKPSIEHDD